MKERALRGSLSDHADDNEMLARLQHATFQYFLREANLENGLIADNTAKRSPSSITVVGLALTAYPVGVERGFMTREGAVNRTLTTLRFFWHSPQGPSPDAIGYKGFFYHFLDMETGRRALNCEISTIDTTFFLAGALTAALYFDGETEKEREIRELADALYRRADWHWALNGGTKVSHGWNPETGFIPYCWEGYSEALLLYMLGLGSPTYPLSEQSYHAWTETYEWRDAYGYQYLYAGPLFIHQLSHVWIDFRGIQDEFMREKDIDYFENSRRATYAQHRYAVENPQGFQGYGPYAWGVTASTGPGPQTLEVDGSMRHFYGYFARGADPDDGTLAPWAAITSLPFAPELVLRTIRHFDEVYPEMVQEYGFRCSFNPTFPGNPSGNAGWVADGYLGLNQGPIVVMIENYWTGLIWRLMQTCPYLVRGLRRAGFRNGWLNERSEIE